MSILNFRSTLSPVQEAIQKESQEEARAMFAAIDTDKSGEVTIDELRAFMQREDPSVTEEQVWCRFDFLNADGQGYVSTEEFGQRQTLDKQSPAVDLNGWYAGVVVTKLQSTSWEELRMVITPDVLVFGPAAEGGYDDVIPLDQIGRLQEISNNNGGRAEGRWGPMRSICLIFTEEEGYNLGRKYCISVDVPLNIHEGEAGARVGRIGQHVTDGKFTPAQILSSFLTSS